MRQRKLRMIEAKEVEIWGIVYDKDSGRWFVTLRDNRGKDIPGSRKGFDNRDAAVRFLVSLLPEDRAVDADLIEGRGQQVAQTIIKQMGGWGRIKAMTGANRPISFDPEDESEHGWGRGGVRWTFPNKRGPNHISIILNARDLYDMEFGRTRGMTHKMIKRVSNVSANKLKDVFERETGLYLSL